MSPKLEEAITFLRRRVTPEGGRVRVTDLVAEAKRRGLNRDFLKVAKKRLGLIATCDRDAKGRRTQWWWHSPRTPPQSARDLPPLWRPGPEDTDFFYFIDQDGKRRLTHPLGDEYAEAVQQGRIPPPTPRKTRGDRLTRLECFQTNFGKYLNRK